MRVVALLLSFVPLFASAVEVQAGPYRIAISTDPAIVPVGSAKLVLAITDKSGKPAGGLQVSAIARMPGMPMGETEQRATPVAGKPGVYSAPASFPMAGAYEVAIRISGPPGNAGASASLRTGENTSVQSAGGSPMTLVLLLLGIGAVAFIVYRMRATGQRPNIGAAFTLGTLVSVFLLAALVAIAVYAVNAFRRPGSMTPLESQGMEMNMPAPPSPAPVELGTVARGIVSETVRYSGQARAYVEQDLNARVPGTIVWMPFYAGDRVKKGQVLARLDTSQLDPQLAERAAMTNIAVESLGVAATEYQAKLQEIAEARAAVVAKEAMVSEAKAMLEAAMQERQAAEQDVQAMLADLSGAQAEVASAEQNAKFRSDELARSRMLFANKAISRSELQQAEAEEADAQAKLRQARSSVRQAEAKVSSSRAGVRKADAMAAAAQKRVRQAEADVAAARAAVRSRQGAAQAAKRNISKERAGVSQAQAGYASAAAQKGYASLKAEVDGVVVERPISPGVLVSPGQTVLRVAQIAPIRLQANVAWVDLERIKVGAPVTISAASVSAGRPSGALRAKISSIQPSVDPQSRTGVAEVLYPNSDGRFLPGQFVSMDIEVGAASGLNVPVEAVQRPPDGEPFVWVAEPTGVAGRFTVRRVRVRAGASDGQVVAVAGDLREGMRVVVLGGTGLREGAEVSVSAAPTPGDAGVNRSGEALVEVTPGGFSPGSVTVSAGVQNTITFVRRTDQTCGTEVVFPTLGIRKPLPLNERVEVTLTPAKAGEVRFTCGMGMLRGKVVVR